jgi:hypothetical protein
MPVHPIPGAAAGLLGPGDGDGHDAAAAAHQAGLMPERRGPPTAPRHAPVRRGGPRCHAHADPVTGLFQDRFHEDLERLEVDVQAPGSPGPGRPGPGHPRVVTGNTALCGAVVAGDDEIDRRYLDIERQVVDLVGRTRQSPPTRACSPPSSTSTCIWNASGTWLSTWPGSARWSPARRGAGDGPATWSRWARTRCGRSSTVPPASRLPHPERPGCHTRRNPSGFERERRRPSEVTDIRLWEPASSPDRLRVLELPKPKEHEMAARTIPKRHVDWICPGGLCHAGP